MKNNKKTIFLIDPIEKLNLKKDGSLFWAQSLREKGSLSYLMFVDDLAINNKAKVILSNVYNFDCKIKDDFYIKSFELKNSIEIELDSNVEIVFRLDPPFNERYLKILWVLTFLQTKGVKVRNTPYGILNNNEKLLALSQDLSAESIILASPDKTLEAVNYFDQLKHSELILKPVNLYQGLGIKKINVKKFKQDESYRKESLEHLSFPLILQEFIQEVYNGEIRATYFKAKQIGCIVKIPPQGSFLANIAGGASFKKIDLNEKMALECEMVAQELLEQGIELISFDILGNKFSEINITCPGLLVETSHALGKNIIMEFGL